jgi:D-alanyl-D-alanine carboxypeptidase
VGSHRAEPAAADAPSRRRGRASEQTRSASVTHAPADRATGRPGRNLARLGVLVALVGITVVVPVSQRSMSAGAAVAGDALTDSTAPGTVEALTSVPLSVLPPASLVSADATAVRSTLTASRSDERDPLPGCDGTTRPAGSNGLLKVSDLCTLWDGRTQIRADAAVSFAVLNQAFVARFGADMCLESGYRTLAQQRSVKAQKGGLAAPPGKSNHGWGLAIDLCKSETTGVKWTWLNENGPAYGWDNPSWARPGGSGPFERWHWEFSKGVQADGEYYG